jgi:hypothetical protein
MSKRETYGQGTTEFILVLGVLTTIGIAIMFLFTNQGKDAIGTAQQSATDAISKD